MCCFVGDVTSDIDMLVCGTRTHVQHDVKDFSQKYKYINCGEGADKNNKKNLLIKYEKRKRAGQAHTALINLQ